VNGGKGAEVRESTGTEEQGSGGAGEQGSRGLGAGEQTRSVVARQRNRSIIKLKDVDLSPVFWHAS
jgi:hypothetical protein